MRAIVYPSYIFWCLLLFCLNKSAAQDTAIIAFTLEDSTLIPEGINYYESSNSFFVSSIHQKKIIEINAATGEVQDFIRQEQNGYQGGVGLCIDQKNHLLYALCYSIVDSNFVTGLYIYDLKTRALILRIKEDDQSPKLFNDLVLDKKGNLYITDTERNCIWSLKKGSRELVLFYEEENLYPNGIAIDPNQDFLYVAAWEKGILRLDLSTKEMKSIHHGQVTSRSVDGLYYYNDALVAIHNGAINEIAQYSLDKSGMCTDRKIIDQENKHFEIPTTGVFVGNYFYCIANSQLSKIDQKLNTIRDHSNLNHTIILKYFLGKKKKRKR